MPARHQTIVTNHGMKHVASWQGGASIMNGEYRISLFRVLPSGKFWHHPVHHNRLTTEEEARAFALTHGFSQIFYRREWCTKCRTLHKFCHAYTGPCAEASGYGYEGAAEAQAEWDKEDVTCTPVTCDCGRRHWVKTWTLAIQDADPRRQRECWQCRWARRDAA